jgi:hypothetical protein
MKLEEALKRKKFGYKGTREEYDIHDEKPNVLILDNNYNVDGKGRSILGFNLNYLDDLSATEKRSLISRVNAVDNKILNIKGIRAWLRSTFNRGDYEKLSIDQKIERYKKIIKEFPELKNIIRRYKYSGVK